ncbi:hypothetical protein MTY59_53240 [Mycobacterium senriense]|uniref:Uncharacterized protein n=1 Tax=Mycobacterium senriense TaxID=2775496 RepID=A0ABN6IPM9_9MYCO|nr:hypothetical protein MTY59_53240 [Mycobacterium senriense]
MVPENMRVFFHEIDTGVTSRGALTCRAHTPASAKHAWPGRNDQRRAMQIRVKISRSGAVAAGARGWVPAHVNPVGVNDNGAGISTDCGDNRFHVRGRSFVIHALRNGLWLVLFAGAEDRSAVRATRLRATGC